VNRKALIVANIDNFHISFNLPYIKLLKDNGYIVDIASKGDKVFSNCKKKYNIKFGRTPLQWSNISAYIELRKVIIKNQYNLIYCNTPVCGAITRLAIPNRMKKNIRVVYSAHGFSFYTGLSKVKYQIYLFIEKFLSKRTDCIVTMNKEDYDAAKSLGFKCEMIANVNGVGINIDRFDPPSPVNKKHFRDKYNFNENDLILIYPAELTDRKNQILLLKIVEILTIKNSNVRLLLAGEGENSELLEDKVSELNLTENVVFLGYVDDIAQLYKVADILVASSLTEGLPINIIEGMASGLPVVATNVRGHCDLVKSGYNGFLFEVGDITKAVECIELLYNNKEIYKSQSQQSINASKKYNIETVISEYKAIFNL
jgi:glycosyltransferase EpsD